MALLIPDEKCLVLQLETFSLSSKNGTGYHPGAVAPSATDPAPLSSRIFRLFFSKLGFLWNEPTKISTYLIFDQRLSKHRYLTWGWVGGEVHRGSVRAPHQPASGSTLCTYERIILAVAEIGIANAKPNYPNGFIMLHHDLDLIRPT